MYFGTRVSREISENRVSTVKLTMPLRTLAMVLLFVGWGSQSARAECLVEEQSLRGSINGADGVNWVINNYVDLEPRPGPDLFDYHNNVAGIAKTYDGYQGVDINLPNFR